ncbi:DUF4192 domain-containing protein [Streptomyces sp. NBC_00102]|uniref:DUF4192 domain-containing protein n=1 Tax=Streptomyces sp. NBC_00102 TaxID=2975652 RepID=UPI002253AD05|nr:DUF4192 domain-containing protein [Streptomyces sp. NBC_00102]MCX5400221.1 DUF4192 domain-containing protein [Streptomyces sp. NBC_00102]
MNKHHESTGPIDTQQVTLRGPADLADALPYLLGFHPDDSVVLVALHGGRGRFGGRLRHGIPQSETEWGRVADQLADCLISDSGRRGDRPDAIVLFLCQDPDTGEAPHEVMERLRPFAQLLRTACGSLDVPVLEALCISNGRYWSYCCPDGRCCPRDGNPLALPGTTVMAAAATYAGIQVRGSLRELEQRLVPWSGAHAPEQLRALDEVGAAMVTRILDPHGRSQVAGETLNLARCLLERVGRTPVLPAEGAADFRDDGLIGHDEAAAVILGLQDRETRDRAARWMEGSEGHAALRLWRALARRCVGPYMEHAAAPLALAAWVSWSTGDEPGARVALSLALRADPDYTFAQLLHQACNEGVDPEKLRRCLREEEEEALKSAAGEGAPRPEATVPRRAGRVRSGASAGSSATTRSRKAAVRTRPVTPANPGTAHARRRERLPRGRQEGRDGTSG